jgi:hypothetical protein
VPNSSPERLGGVEKAKLMKLLYIADKQNL